MNISKNTVGKCEKKCEYTFNYSSTNLVARNMGDYISYRPGPQRDPPVMYNGEHYNVKEMELYQPALHSFGGEKADAEIVIEHTKTNGTGNLYVCVPVRTITSQESTILDKLIANVANLAPTKGGNAGDISLPFFSFSAFVPTKPYYSYKGTMPGSNVDNQDIIVYSKEYAIPISKQGRRSLLKLVQKNNYNSLGNIEGFASKAHDKIYFNKQGAKKSSGDGDDEIYIDCQPTGESGEVLIDTPDTSNNVTFSDENIKSLMNNKFIKGIGSLLIAILIMILLMKLITFSFSSSNQITSLPRSIGISPNTR